MIKKNTEIVFENNEMEAVNIEGGMPLSKGEIINLHPDGSELTVQYEVVGKTIDYYKEGEDHIINISYILGKK